MSRSRKIWFGWIGWLLCMATLLQLVGCRPVHSQDSSGGSGELMDRTERLEELEDPLIVFYMREAGAIVQNFEAAHPEIEIKSYRMDSRWSVDEDTLSDMIVDNGAPDLVLLNKETDLYWEAWAENGLISNIDEYVEADETIQQSTYFPGTFTLFQDDQGLWALPLGVSVDMITVREENWERSAFAALPENYTGMELIDALEQEMEDMDKGEFMTTKHMGGIVEWLYRGGEIGEDGGMPNEASFEKLYKVLNEMGSVNNEARTYWQNEQPEYSSQDCYTLDGIDPGIYEGKFKISLWRSGSAADIRNVSAAPQVIYPYALSAGMYHLNQDVHALYFPTMEDGSKFGARVNIYGAVGSADGRRQYGYDLLRLMMDEPMKTFMVPGMTDTDTFSPVHIENAVQMIEDFDEQEGDLMIFQSWGDRQHLFTMEKQKLSEERKVEMEKVLRNISFLYYCDQQWKGLNDVIARYSALEIDNLSICYREVADYLQ